MKLRHWASRAAFGLAVVLMAAGFWSFREAARTADGANLSIDAMAKSAGPVRAGSTVEVPFLFTNRGRTSIRVVGASGTCNQIACLSVESLPIEIPAGSRLEIPVTVRTYNPGRNEQTIPIYTDCPGKTIVDLVVSVEVTSQTLATAASGIPAQ